MRGNRISKVATVNFYITVSLAQTLSKKLMIYSVYIINKAGGLIYQKDYAEGLNKLTSNEYLVLAGTFHGINAIASKISPTGKSSGITQLETDYFKLTVLTTLTGMLWGNLWVKSSVFFITINYYHSLYPLLLVCISFAITLYLFCY